MECRRGRFAKPHNQSECGAEFAPFQPPRFGQRTLSPAQQNALPPDYDYELFVGNDVLASGDDQDLVVGDFAVDALPISLRLPANDQQKLLQRQDVRELMDDMELFLENWHHPNDTVPIQQRYTHAHYDERRGAAQEIPLHAGNDSIDGGAGADFVLADSDSAAVTNQVEAPSQRDLEVDPEWKVEYLNRMFFELTAHYSRDAAVSDINEDQVIGGDGNDLLFGQWNDDTMQGNAGNDLVYGGSGQNTVSGGAGTNDVRAGSEDTPSKTELDNLKDRVFDAQEPWFNELVRDIAEAPTGTQSGLDLNPITGSLHGTPTISTAVPLGIYELASRIGSEWQVAEMTTEELFATVWGAGRPRHRGSTFASATLMAMDTTISWGEPTASGGFRTRREPSLSTRTGDRGQRTLPGKTSLSEISTGTDSTTYLAAVRQMVGGPLGRHAID